jgi:heat shock protein HslJ
VIAKGRPEPIDPSRRPGTVRSIPAALSFAGIVALLSACSVVGGGSPAPAARLDGRTFLSSSVTGRDLVPGTTVRLSFKDGQLGIEAGCNHMSGPYSVHDGRIRIESMLTTEMGCEPRLMDQDTWVGQFVGGATAALEGNALTLANGGVSMLLTDRAVADPDRPLVGTRWVVDGVVSGDAVSSIPAGVEAALTFTSDRIAVETACNNGGGPVTIEGPTFTAGPLALTKKACVPETAAVESAVLATLNGQVGYTIEAARLRLSDGASGLTLHAAS